MKTGFSFGPWMVRGYGGYRFRAVSPRTTPAA